MVEILVTKISGICGLFSSRGKEETANAYVSPFRMVLCTRSLMTLKTVLMGRQNSEARRAVADAHAEQPQGEAEGEQRDVGVISPDFQIPCLLLENPKQA